MKGPLEDGWSAAGGTPLAVLTFLDTVSDAVVAADQDGVVVHANAAVEAVLGWAPHELVGRPVAVLVPPGLQQQHIAAFQRHMTGGPSTITGGPPVHLWALHRSGREVEVELSLRDLPTAAGTLSVGVLRDLTTQRRLAEATSLATYHRVTSHVATQVALVNEVHSLSDASAVLLEAAATALQWDAAIMWLVAENGSAHPVDHWNVDGLDEGVGLMADPGLVTVPGRGLPGRVIQTGEPAWIEDVGKDPGYFRREVAQRHGIVSTFAFPIMRGDAVEAVVELMSRRRMAVDDGLLAIVAEVGRHVGEYLTRRAAERAVARSEARKGAILRSAFDAVIGINHQGQVTDWNPAAERILGHPAQYAVGRHLGDLVVPEDLRSAHEAGLQRYLDTRRSRILGEPLELRALHADGHEFPVELAITQLEDVEPPEFVGYLRDISERKGVERALVRSHDELTRVAATLQDSLMPTTLPEVPGYDVGTAFRPAGDGSEIGGDFYDLFRLDGSRLAALVGDVCGKGVEAARLTSLVRYTARAAAVESRDPEVILRLVNQAILKDGGDSTFCTVAYVEIDLDVPGRLRLVRAGHPAPMLVDAGGRSTAVGIPGSLLGVLEEPTLTVTTLQLAAEESLVLYTDGLIEARTGTGLLGRSGLVGLLAEVPGVSAQMIADHLRRRTVEEQGGRTSDDLAVLVLRRC